MSENNAPVVWPPQRRQHHHTNVTATSEKAMSSCQETPSCNAGILHTPLLNKVNCKHYRNGFETMPKVPAFRPYTLNSPGFPRQQAFTIASPVQLESHKALNSLQWNTLARDAGLLQDGSHLHDFQMECANAVMEQGQDVIVVSPTGSGKSLVLVFEGPVQSSLFAFLGKTGTRTGPSGPWTIFGPVKTGLSKDQSSPVFTSRNSL
jgi:hypothetical protein